ncbi:MULTISPECIES: 6-carboxytetrahydropterin synthase [unclassified Microbacterium]|uniref:6-carboxytetrahydropterin synthase n=1 Tax=unclassified Microbacterium TaxID=2609290 RepID=UPI0025E8B040|nr:MULTISPECIES: 6-carboxytetrahydropterin synthase [unclassified Microbacterium]
MTLSISRDFRFSASHTIEGLPIGHKCARLHGHTYRVSITIEGTTDAVGMILDFADLDWVGRYLSDTVDHRHLNDVLPFNPTSELIAQWISLHVRDELREHPARGRLVAISALVSESEDTRATSRVRI